VGGGSVKLQDTVADENDAFLAYQAATVETHL
jgi:hypothetical protein